MWKMLGNQHPPSITVVENRLWHAIIDIACTSTPLQEILASAMQDIQEIVSGGSRDCHPHWFKAGRWPLLLEILAVVDSLMQALWRYGNQASWGASNPHWSHSQGRATAHGRRRRRRRKMMMMMRVGTKFLRLRERSNWRYSPPPRLHPCKHISRLVPLPPQP